MITLNIVFINLFFQEKKKYTATKDQWKDYVFHLSKA